MRSNGVRSIRADCLRCGHDAVVNLDAFSDDETVPSFAQAMRCTARNDRPSPPGTTAEAPGI
jgi:hypothetical protein